MIWTWLSVLVTCTDNNEVKLAWRSTISTTFGLKHLYFSIPNLTAIVKLSLKQSLVKYLLHSTEWSLGPFQPSWVLWTCLIYCNCNKVSCGNRNSLAPSLGVLEQLAATQHLTYCYLVYSRPFDIWYIRCKIKEANTVRKLLVLNTTFHPVKLFKKQIVQMYIIFIVWLSAS